MPKKKGIGAKALREAIANINRMSDTRRKLIPGEIEYDLKRDYPMKRMK